MTPAADPHPTPARRSIVAPLAALIAGPAAWATQLIAGYGYSSLACFPHDAPAAQPPSPGEHALLIGLNLTCLVVALAGLVTATIHWRAAKAEGSAKSSDVLPPGLGRARFLAACGMLSGMGFAIAILFDTVAILGAPACWSLIR